MVVVRGMVVRVEVAVVVVGTIAWAFAGEKKKKNQLHNGFHLFVVLFL